MMPQELLLERSLLDGNVLDVNNLAICHGLSSAAISEIPDMTSESNPSDSMPLSSDTGASVDYPEVIRFLVGPFLDSADSLRIHCETNPRNGRVLIRLAIEGEDKGKVFGRGGRNIQAVRTTLQAVSTAMHQKVYLEVFGSESGRRKNDHPSGGGGRRSAPSPPRRNSRPRPNPS